jgi:uncharacterized protein (TIGR00730 family)
MAAIRSVCVYCGSSPGRDAAFVQSAEDLGRLLADRRITLVYGGGHVGLMGAIADATMAAGGQVHGVITRALERKEVAHQGLGRLQITESMHDRKAAMAEASDGFIMLPGGLGTLEEFFEAATWTQLGIQSKPCGVLNVGGYFDPLIDLLNQFVEQRFLRPEHRDQIVVDPEPEALVEALFAWEPVGVDKWRRFLHLSPNAAGSQRGPKAPRQACLRYARARVGGVLRDLRPRRRCRSGALFGARAGAASGTHNTGCRGQFRMPIGRCWRPPCPCSCCSAPTWHFGATPASICPHACGHPSPVGAHPKGEAQA